MICCCDHGGPNSIIINVDPADSESAHLIVGREFCSPYSLVYLTSFIILNQHCGARYGSESVDYITSIGGQITVEIIK